MPQRSAIRSSRLALIVLCTVSAAQAQWTERLPLLSERDVAQLSRVPLYRLTLRLARYRLQEVIELENDAGAAAADRAAPVRQAGELPGTGGADWQERQLEPNERGLGP